MTTTAGEPYEPGTPGAPTAEELEGDATLYPPAEQADDAAVDEHGDELEADE